MKLIYSALIPLPNMKFILIFYQIIVCYMFINQMLINQTGKNRTFFYWAILKRTTNINIKDIT